MKFVLAGLVAAVVSTHSIAAGAQGADSDRWRAAMESARWTGPMLASNAETLPHGHFYTEPYFFDSISGGHHSFGSSGFYQYGLLDSLTVGVQPNLSFGTDVPGRGTALGDFKLLSQVRLTHFTPNHRVPTVALVVNEGIPVGKYDRLGPSQDGHGSGSFATEVGINVQNYWLLGNGRLLRGRINLLHNIPYGTDVAGRSVYGTAEGFIGHARPGARTTVIGAVEYSLTREWVVALDVIGEGASGGRVDGRYGTGPLISQTSPSSWYVGFAPAVEYNWSDRAGALFGLWVNPKGHNSPASVTPAIAIQRFW